MSSLDRLRDFVIGATKIADAKMKNEETVSAVKPLLAKLIEKDDWLPDDYAQPHPDYYRQYLLHADPLERFSIVSFVWGPGQKTPIHDHRVRGLVGVLRGAELSTDYTRTQDGALLAIKKSGWNRIQSSRSLPTGAISTPSAMLSRIAPRSAFMSMAPI